MILEIDGTILLLFLPHNSQFPIDGIRFQEPEAKFTLPAGPRVSGGILLSTSLCMLNLIGVGSPRGKIRIYPRFARHKRLTSPKTIPPSERRSFSTSSCALYTGSSYTCVT